MTPRPGASSLTREDLEQALNRLRGEFEQKNKDLEGRLVAQLSSQLASQLANMVPGALPAPSAAAPSEKGSLASMVRELVAENETLFCTQNTALIKACEVALRQKGFSVTAASTVEEAQSRIQEFAYQVIIFDYRFVQASQEGQNLLASIRNITLPVRRHQSVVLITPGLPTCESQVFYQLGVDLNISPDDLSALGVLVRELVDHKMALLEPYLTSSLDTDRLMM
jgi:CheY-like chemotaxis protein